MVDIRSTNLPNVLLIADALPDEFEAAPINCKTCEEGYGIEILRDVDDADKELLFIGCLNCKVGLFYVAGPRESLTKKEDL